MPKGIGYPGKRKKNSSRKKGSSKKGAAHSGPVIGPNSTGSSGKLTGGGGNAQQTPEKVASESYVKARGG